MILRVTARRDVAYCDGSSSILGVGANENLAVTRLSIKLIAGVAGTLGLERSEFLLSSLKILPGFPLFAFAHCYFPVFLK